MGYIVIEETRNRSKKGQYDEVKMFFPKLDKILVGLETLVITFQERVDIVHPNSP
jgi:hypothetical protein